MTLPFDMPAWVPWWGPVVVLIPVLLYALVFFVMPFSVIGVKGRLDALDARLDDIQEDLRILMERLPEPVAGRIVEDTTYTRPPGYAEDEPGGPVARASGSRPPIPPAPLVPERPGEPLDLRRRAGERAGGRAARSEPRLDWPR